MSAGLFGQETEYAIRFSPAPGYGHPGNTLLFEALRRGIKSIVRTRPGERHYQQDQFFVENGGSFCYEFLPYAPDKGLIEGATPECASPAELLTYQRAQESLLKRAAAHATRYLDSQGWRGELGLIKNCRDARGKIYGAQESYEVDVARGFLLWLFRLGLALCVPLAIVFPIVYIGLLLVVGLVLVTAGTVFYVAFKFFQILIRLAAVLRIPPFPWFYAVTEDWLRRIHSFVEEQLQGRAFETAAGHVEYSVVMVILLGMLWPYTMLLRALAFHSTRRALTAFFISRAIISGAGTLLEDGGFALSEKGVATKRMTRLTVGPNDRPLFDNGNLHKNFLLAGMQFYGSLGSGPLRGLFKRKQRLQVGVSDSNRAEMAEFLKFGTTSLVMAAVEAGFPRQPPRVRRPIQALQTLIRDDSLKARVRLRSGERLSAIEIQRIYAGAAREYLDSLPRPRPEDGVILRLWEEVLDGLEKNPDDLVGRLDWVTKRYLIREAGAGADFAVRKKIDIAYHELGRGYFDALEREELAPRLTNDEAVERAVHEPSSPRSARLRSRLMRRPLYQRRKLVVAWNWVRVGGWFRGRVIRLR